MEKSRLILSFFYPFRYIIDMVKKILNYIKKYHMIEAGDTIVAGISGGADSICLLFVMLEMQKQLAFSLEVVHVNHGIREDANKDAEFVEALCKQKGLPFQLIEADIPQRAKELGISEEEAGRQIRYQAFGEMLGSRKGRIAVAHNSNDRAETMLFHLFRGTGLAGASGIRPVNGRIIRPLLCSSRKEIERWLWKREISFCTDSTNLEDDYTRNRIRHHILTYAEREICQGTIPNMSRAADQLLEAEEYVYRQTNEAMSRCVTYEKEKLVIDIPKYLAEDNYLQGRILLSCIEQVAGQRKDITAEHIKNIRGLFEKAGTREIHLPYEVVVYKKYDLGMIQKNITKTMQENTFCEIPVPIPSVLNIPFLGRVETTVFPCVNSENIVQKTYTKWFDYDKISSSVVFRTKRTGDYLTINDKMGHKSLQDYFVNEKIPKDERNKMLVLADASHILWIPGYRISEYYKVGKQTENILEVKIHK